ncbi:unnamed protein product [Ostreobium quekettii]|uniref:DRBM domain-containing protein n=1 Tax=Ostreobium quekettii TaxID=121088 RepID=A0A8S1J3I6_9CHLO|nr:unnamed protein product [Ostreobium quekettii]
MHAGSWPGGGRDGGRCADRAVHECWARLAGPGPVCDWGLSVRGRDFLIGIGLLLCKIRNMPVGVHIKSGRQPGEPCSCSYKLPQFPLDPDPKASINALIRSLRAATDKKPAVTAAFKAAMEGMKRPHVESQQEDRNMVAEQPAAALLDMSSYLDSFAKCKSLMHSIRSSPGGENKTPLAVLHEYATRWNLEVSHEENSASNMGPFDVETKLTDNRGHTYATGAGRGRNKKDARQISAAATLNLLLETLSEDYFIQPGKAKQRSLQAGRGRGRSSAWNASGRGRGNNWTGCKWGLGYRGRSTRTVGQPAANRGSRGGIEAGQKRDYAAMLGLSGPSDINQNLQIQSPNLMGLVGGGMVQGGTALNPLLNQGIGLGAAGVGLPAMMTGVAMGGAAGTGLQRGMTNTIAGVTGNINGNNILGTVTMGGPQVGQQIGTLGAGNGSSQVNGLAWASSLNGATGGAIGLNGGTPALTLGTDGLMGVVGSMGLSGGQQTSMGLLNSAINNLSHVPMGQPNGTNLLGGANLGQQAQTGQFNF